MFGLFIPMGWGAPQGPALVLRQSVQIVPNVAGEVTDVPVEPNKPLKACDVLFKIEMTQLQLSDASRAFDAGAVGKR
jgi:multidrug resistance efflux pump